MSVAGGEIGAGAGAPAAEVEQIVNKIGPKLSELRKEQGLSLQQLATLSDVSPAAIHKIERSGMVPTITTLLKLATALGVTVSHFVEEDGAEPEPVHLTRADHRPTVYTPHPGLNLAGISGSYRQFQTAAAIATMTSGAESGTRPLRHPGEELVLVIKGQAEFTMGDQVFLLGPGDSIHFSGDVPHHWQNTSKQPAELVWIALRNG
jgi:transcriptional regulator with XRE-family HTH domain